MGNRIGGQKDRLAAVEAAGDTCIPHAAAVAMMTARVRSARFATTAGSRCASWAERSGISLSYLSEIEHGRKRGSVAVLTRVADALGTRIDALVMD